MPKVKTIVSCFSLAVMPALAAAQAQTTPPRPRPASAPPAGPVSTRKTTAPATAAKAQKAMDSKMSHPMDDKDFILKAAQGGNTEVALGTLAETNASSAAVKAAGKKIAADHLKAGAELKTLAAAKNVTISDTDFGEGVSIKDQLTGMKGEDFDKMWIDHVIDEHKKDIAMFEAQTMSSDPQVKAFASKTLPTLRQHLAMVQKLKK